MGIQIKALRFSGTCPKTEVGADIVNRNNFVTGG